jgi:hypothetical protein
MTDQPIRTTPSCAAPSDCDEIGGKCTVDGCPFYDPDDRAYGARCGHHGSILERPELEVEELGHIRWACRSCFPELFRSVANVFQDTIAEILGMPAIPTLPNGETDWPAFARHLQALREPCTAVIHHGPGHQSKTTCEHKGPHTEHGAWLGGEHTGYYEWTSDHASADYDGESRPVVLCPDCGVLRDPAKVEAGELCTGYKCERERAEA